MNNIILTISVVALIAGCTNSGDKNRDPSAVISADDIHEADQVRSILNSAGGAKGNFTVEPGPSVIIVYITSPDKPRDEEAARTYMRAIKAQLARENDREANTLKFVFKEATLEE